jgi:acyl-CoA dehydrogenase
MMDFSLTPKLEELRDRTRSFIRDQVIPFEKDPRQNEHGPGA